jgi:hypothetical protein
VKGVLNHRLTPREAAVKFILEVVVGEVGIDFCDANIGMAKELANVNQRCPILEEVGCKGMSKRVCGGMGALR